MSEVERIIDQLERAYRGGAWHGPSLCELLDGVDGDRASARPVGGAHSIRELVLHVMAWEKETTARIGGGGVDDVAPENDWPDDPIAWEPLVEELGSVHDRLKEAIRALDDGALHAPTKGSAETLYHLLHGVVQHNLYHAGQIALLKKAL